MLPSRSYYGRRILGFRAFASFSSEAETAEASCGVRDGHGDVVVINMNDKRIKPKVEQIYKCQRPVLFKHLAKDWPAMKWLGDLDGLRKRLNLSDKNDIVVPLEIGPGSYMSEDRDFQKIHVGLSSLFDTLEIEMEMDACWDGKGKRGLQWYLAQIELKELSPILLEDIDTHPAICKTGQGDLYRTQLWLNGASGNFSECHYDPFNNLLCQLYGEKTVTLYDCPEPSDAMYPAKGTVQKNTSAIPFGALLREADGQGQMEVDRNAFPLFYDISKKTQYGPITLKPGDAIFIPFKYWHFIHSPSVSLSVNHWWL